MKPILVVSLLTFTAFTALAEETLPAPWKHQDITAAKVPGTAEQTAGVFSLQGTLDIWGTADGSHLVWQPLRGDAELVARVAAMDNPGGVAHAKASLCIRESLAAGSRHVTMCVTPTDGTQFLYRDQADGKTTRILPDVAAQTTSVPKEQFPCWLKIVRRGEEFSGYESMDGQRWHCSGQIKLNLAADAVIGLAASSHKPDVLTKATFDHVQLSSQSGSATSAIDFTSPVEKVAGEFQFTEGPVWLVAKSELLFSDIPANRIVRFHDGKCETFRSPSRNSNGLTFDKQGHLIACEHGSRRVTRTEIDGTVTVLAERCAGKRLNSPNDVVVKSDGTIYFTDPPYGVKREERELDFQGVYRISADGKTLSLLVKDFAKPNGLAFTPDEKILYINDTERGHIRAFDVAPDGTLTHSRVFAQTPGADGMKVQLFGFVGFQ